MKQMRGFGVIAALVVLVMLAALAAAITSLSSTQHLDSAQDVLSARAWQAARAGNEYGLYQALKNSSCGTSTLDLTATTGFQVSVRCTTWSYSEGEDTPGNAHTTRIYRIAATACPTAPCPQSGATVATHGYIERTRVVIATD